MNKVVLGYNSPTEWVFSPESLILYRPIVMNKDVYDEVVDKGLKSNSGYKNTKAQLLIELKNKGALRPIEYSVSEIRREGAKAVFEWFIENREVEMRRCALAAVKAFKEHEMGTFDKLVSKDDPCYQDILKLLPGLDKLEKQLGDGIKLSNVTGFEDVFLRYFEEILLTPYPDDYNPVFTWDGYAQFSDLLLKQYYAPNSDLEASLEKGTKQKVIRTIGEICLPFRPLRKASELEKMLGRCLELDDLRLLVERENEKVWEQLRKAVEIDDKYYSEFAKDFESFVRKRIQDINAIIRNAKEEIDKKHTELTYKITRAFINTVCSIIPGTGGFGLLLEGLSEKLIGHKQQVPKSVRAILDYEQTLDKVNLKRGPIKPYSEVKSDYEVHRYWIE